MISVSDSELRIVAAAADIVVCTSFIDMGAPL
jgi:hypothetical protein